MNGRIENSDAFNTIGEIHDALTAKLYSPKALFDYIDENYSDESKDSIPGSETDYHNLGVEFSRQKCERYAAAVSIIGLETYPMSPDLLADAIKYSQEIGDIESCQAVMDILDNVDASYWKWRTFVFVIDFLKDSLGYSKDMEGFESNQKLAKKFIEDFKRIIPHEERAYVAEAELYQNQNDYESAISALRNGIAKVRVAPQCCLKLADIYMELGEYAEVEKMARKGVLATIQDQPTVSIGYIYYLLAMSMDAQRIIRRDSEDKDRMNEEEIKAIVKAYVTADRLFVNEGREGVSYRKTIEAKLIMIEMEEGIFVNDCISSSKQEKDSAN